MPLNGSDVASRVIGSTTFPNTTIESSKYNADLDDIYGIFNSVRTVSKGSTGASSFTVGNVLTGNGTSAIQAEKAAPSGNFVGTTDTQTLTNKTLTSPTLNSPAIATPTGEFVATANIADNAVTLAKQAGGTADRLQGFNGSGDPAEVTIGAGLSLSAGALSSTTSGTPAGVFSWYAGSTAPTGYLECNGAAVSRTTYADLFTAISTTYGTGDGSTTFNLPDTRGEFVRGWDHSRGVDSGRALGSTQSDALKAHTHSYNVVTTGQGGYNPGSPGQDGNAASTTGSTGSTETRPRNIAMMGIIKT